MSIVEFLLARVAEDEEVARLCTEMFPPPWDVADRGWRVRIYAADVPTEDLISDDPEAMTTRNPVVMEVEPDRHIRDPRWLSERVEHVRRHDPARVLAECAAKRAIAERYTTITETTRQAAANYQAWLDNTPDPYPGVSSRAHAQDVAAELETVLHHLATVYADHPDCRQEWKP